MYRKLPLLSGLAILGVVLNHATGWGFTAMFLWTHRYAPVDVPNFDQIGSLNYYITLFLRQVTVFAVPAFFFVSGAFIAYAVRSTQTKTSWKFLWKRLLTLLIPYLIWAALFYLFDFTLGNHENPLKYVISLFSPFASGPYWFITVLFYLYLISPLLVPLIRRWWKWVLVFFALFLLAVVTIRAVALFYGSTPALDTIINLTPSGLFLRWVLFYSLGILAGLRPDDFSAWIGKYKYVFLAAAVVFGLAVIFETDFAFRRYGFEGGGTISRLSFNFYALSFILAYLALDFRIPYTRQVTQLGQKSYGIFLMHFLIITVVAKAIYHLVPSLLNVQIVFQPVLFIAGLGGSLLAMYLVSKTPFQKYSRYLFG